MIYSIKEKLKEIKGSIKEGLDFDNPTQRNAFLTAFIVLVAFLSFGLGRLSGLETVRKDIEVKFPEKEISAVGASFLTDSAQFSFSQKTSGKYIASKNGTKYYLVSCASAKRIGEKNKVWFDTKTEAETAGYLPAANCKGL
jgi:hypothetical protein